MMVYVIDASVVLTALLHKSGKVDEYFRSVLYQKKKDKVQIYSSPFILLEIANGLRFTLDDVAVSEEILGRFKMLPIDYFAVSDQHIQEALRKSYHYDTTVYDSIYHVIAKLLNGTLLTCDRHYFIKAKDWGNIKLLT